MAFSRYLADVGQSRIIRFTWDDRMRVGQIFRYAIEKDPRPTEVDGYPNFFHYTHTQGLKRALLEAGINPIAAISGPDGRRVPAILVSSSPHKIGSSQTPWQDFFNPDQGHVRYYGDAKTAGQDPASSPGNASLLAAKRMQDSMSREERRRSPPIIMFRRVRVGKRVKGFPMFQGFGVIERAELIAQFDAKNGNSFPNFAYDIAVFDLAANEENFDWGWISNRRNAQLSVSETERLAPKSWLAWVAGGSQAIPNLKRRVAKLLTTPTSEQSPARRSNEFRAVDKIYRFYDGRKHRFELLAARIVAQILERNGGRYRFGWITPPSSDGGADFVGRLDIGSGFSVLRQVVFGQAKCETPGKTTRARDIARTVARLRRGWIGAYVTLGTFSVATQREVIEDEYPILLVPGERVAREVLGAATQAGFAELEDYLADVDSHYERSVVERRPEELLLS